MRLVVGAKSMDGIAFPSAADRTTTGLRSSAVSGPRRHPGKRVAPRCDDGVQRPGHGNGPRRRAVAVDHGRRQLGDLDLRRGAVTTTSPNARADARSRSNDVPGTMTTPATTRLAAVRIWHRQRHPGLHTRAALSPPPATMTSAPQGWLVAGRTGLGALVPLPLRETVGLHPAALSGCRDGVARPGALAPRSRSRKCSGSCCSAA